MNTEASDPQWDMDKRKRMSANAPGDAAWQLEDLICNLVNLADDVETRAAQGAAAPEVLPQVIAKLREISRRCLRNFSLVQPFELGPASHLWATTLRQLAPRHYSPPRYLCSQLRWRCALVASLLSFVVLPEILESTDY